MVNIFTCPKRLFCRVIKYFLVTFLLITLLVLCIGIARGLLRSPSITTSAPAHITMKKPAAQIKGYQRPEESTYLSFPEWYIVYSSQAYAQHLRDHSPSAFPYLEEIAGFWESYHNVYALTKDNYPLNTEDHIMLIVIGSSLSIEYAMKSVYENTIGRVFEWSRFGDTTEEDNFMSKSAQRYAQLIPHRPWYEFSFYTEFKNLWTTTPFFSKHWPRKMERKLLLSTEYLFKAIYASIIQWSSHSAFGVSDDLTYMTIQSKTNDLQSTPKVSVIKKLKHNRHIIALPRYQPFTSAMLSMVKHDIEIENIAGNQHILISYTRPKSMALPKLHATVAFNLPVSTDNKLVREALIVPVGEVIQTIRMLDQHHIIVEHIYDY